MADRKISDLTALTAPASGDYLPIVDISEASAANKNKRITIEELLRGAPDGTAAAPGFAFESDGGNGFYLAGTDTVGLATNGSARLLINGSGRAILETNTFVSGGGLIIRNGSTTSQSALLFGPISGSTGSLVGSTLGDLSGSTPFYLNASEFNFNTDKVQISNLGAISAASFIPTSNTVPTNGLYLPAANSVALATNGTGRLFVDADGNVGINAAAPTASNAAGYREFAIRGGSTDRTGILRLNDSAGTTGGAVYANEVSGLQIEQPLARPIAFSTNGSEKVRITSDGKVGVGTSSPGQQLHVVGAIASTGQAPALTSSSIFLDYITSLNIGRFAVVGNTTGAAAPIYFSQYSSNGSIGRDTMAIDSSGRVGVGTTTPAQQLHVKGSSTTKLLINSADNAVDRGVYFGSSDNTELGYLSQEYSTGLLTLSAGTGEYQVGMRFNAAGFERARIDSSGTLTVKGAGTAGVNAAVSFNGSAPVNSLIVNSSGNVGIKTSSPSNTLHVAGTGRFNVSGANNAVIASDGGDPFIYTEQAAGLKLGTNSAVRMTINSSGNVGIGTTSPSCQLNTQTSSTGELARFASSSASGEINLSVGYTTTNQFKVAYDITTGDGILQTNAAGSQLIFKSAGGEAARIDASKRLLVGTSSARLYTSLGYARFQVEGTAFADSSIGLTNNQATVDGSYLVFNKTRGTAVGGTTIVASGDQLGAIWFQGADGSGVSIIGATIKAEVDATPGTSDMPGRLVFSTTADGASSPTEKLRIDSAGTIQADGRNGTSTQIFYSILPSSGNSRNHFFGNTVGVGTWALQENGTSTWTSDERRKKNIETTRDGYLEDLAQLRVVKYNWNVQADDEPKELGLIAQEVEQVFPGLVIEADEPQEGDDYKLKSVKFSVLPFMLLKALQEAATKIETLEAKVAALEAA